MPKNVLEYHLQALPQIHQDNHDPKEFPWHCLRTEQSYKDRCCFLLHIKFLENKNER